MRTIKLIGLIVAILGLLTAMIALITEGIKLYRELPTATPQHQTISGTTATPVSPVANEKAVFLSDLIPKSIEAAGNNYCVGRDPVGDPPTCTGAKIEVQGTSYPHSLFAHANSILIFDLNGKYETFATSIFLFGSQCGDGASFRIELDGKEVFNSSTIQHGEIPHDVRIDVRNGYSLRLETYIGSNNDYSCDGTVWGEPYLISNP
jgi:hypothetical protein